MQPKAELVHWLFGTGILLLGLLAFAEVLIGREIWALRRWRVYLWPSLAFGLGVLMWPVMTFFTNSAIHMLAHSIWAQSLMVMGAAELGLASGKLHSRLWELAAPVAIAVSGLAFLAHEQNPWLFSRAAYLHHLMGWTLLAGSLVALLVVLRPGSLLLRCGFGVFVVALAVMLYCDRDTAPIFGHISPLAGTPHR